MEIKIAEMIKKMREQNKMGQDELGSRLGISGKTISSWENKRSQPRMGMIKDMANIFNVSTDMMVYGTDMIKGLENTWYSDATDKQKENMKRRTLDDVKGWFDEETYQLLVDYLSCSDEGKKWANDRLREAVKLYPKEKEDIKE